MVARTSEEGIIPCVVTNPNITVTLHKQGNDQAVTGLYDPTEGFKALLEDRTYVCRGELNGEVKDSEAFNVITIYGRSKSLPRGLVL